MQKYPNLRTSPAPVKVDRHQVNALRSKATWLRDACYPLAAEIMARPAGDEETVRALARVGRHIGDAAQGLTEAAALLERLAHGPE